MTTINIGRRRRCVTCSRAIPRGTRCPLCQYAASASSAWAPERPHESLRAAHEAEYAARAAQGLPLFQREDVA